MTYKLPEGWKEVKLIDITEKIGSGATPRGGAKVYIDEGISLIRSQNILDFKFSTDGLVYIDEDAAKKLNNVEVFKDDILINITGDSVARTCLAPDYILPARVNQHVSIIRTDEELAYYKYINYKLQDLKTLLLSYSSSGATRKALTKSMLENLKINLPPIKEQKAIADTLSVLDNKIELNNKINENLEQQAQAIFKHWFIDFEFPDENGNPYKSSGGEMVESELGMIPKGWGIYEMDRICERIRPGTNYQPKRIEDGIPFLNIRNINKGYIDCSDAKFISEEDYEKVHSSWVPEKNDVLISRIGTLGLVAVIKEKDLPIAVHYNFIDMKARSISYQLLYFILKSDFFQQKYHMIKKASVQDYVTINEVKELKILLPTNNKLQLDLQMIFNSFFNKIDTRQIQNQKLSQIRDTLLPKLMSGELRIPLD